MSLLTPTGNLMSNIMVNSKQPEPAEGMGCTIMGYTDRYAATIVKVVSPCKIHVQVDRAIRIDDNGKSECQSYRYERYPEAPIKVFTKRKNGRWVREGEKQNNGTSLMIGERRHYYDYSF